MKLPDPGSNGSSREHMLRLGEALGAAGRTGAEPIGGLARRIGAIPPTPGEALLMAQGIAAAWCSARR